MTLKDLQPGVPAKVFSVGAGGLLREHLLDMGIIPGLEIKVLKYAPMGDPVEVLVQNYSLTLRLTEAATIGVTPLDDDDPRLKVHDHFNFGYNLSLHEHNAHPGLGESGKYHSGDDSAALPKGTVLTFALIGQQNCGKTTLFNVLTGSNQHVGNFPGVTVDRKDGIIKGYPETRVTDLPGIYSLSTYTDEELVTRRFLLEDKPHAIINVVDASNLERNFYLTLQLMEIGIPMVLALNMMDELVGNGGSVRLNEMERELGIPIVPVSAARNEGVRELVEHAVHVARFREVPARQDFCDKQDNGGAVHRCLHSIMHLVESKAEAALIPPRFAASRIVVGDEVMTGRLSLSDSEKRTIESVVSEMEESRGLDRIAAMADMRYTFIRRLCNRTLVRPSTSKEYRRSVRLDRILTGKWTSIPIFISVISLVLWLSIDVIGAPLQNLLSKIISDFSSSLDAGMSSLSVSPAVRSLVVDAVFKGVGTVVSFIPVIIVLFFFLSLLEDSGYMARVAFVTDKLLRRIGLSGRSIVPMLIGLGCSVPAVLAARTLPSARDRRKTILLIPYMSCSAKITIYAFLSSAFFPSHGGLVLVMLYLTAILVGIVIARIFKYFGGRSEAAPFVMELPNYRMPRPGNLAHLLWDKTKDFLQKAFTVILVASIVIWLLQSFDFHLRFVQNGEGSMLARLSGFIAPLLSPLGLGDWRIVTSLISGFLAKESVVSTMEVLGVTSSLSPLTAVPLLVFCLLYTPCVAAIASVRGELGRRWAAFVVLFQCLVAWVCAYVAYLLAGLFF